MLKSLGCHLRQLTTGQSFWLRHSVGGGTDATSVRFTWAKMFSVQRRWPAKYHGWCWICLARCMQEMRHDHEGGWQHSLTYQVLQTTPLHYYSAFNGTFPLISQDLLSQIWMLCVYIYIYIYIWKIMRYNAIFPLSSSSQESQLQQH